MPSFEPSCRYLVAITHRTRILGHLLGFDLRRCWRPVPIVIVPLGSGIWESMIARGSVSMKSTAFADGDKP
jgi:hypothetical protein